MEIHRFERLWASDAFAENIAGLWRATPSDVKKFAQDRGWRAIAETASPDGQTLACVDRKRKTVTYFEYCMFDGKRKRSPIDALTHYHELIHLMDVELGRNPILGRVRDYRNLTAFIEDRKRLSAEDIKEHEYYLSVDRVFEMPSDLRMSEQAYGWTVACGEARAQAGAELIVQGHGPIMALAPATTKRVLADIRRTLPSLLAISPARDLTKITDRKSRNRNEIGLTL